MDSSLLPSQAHLDAGHAPRSWWAKLRHRWQFREQLRSRRRSVSLHAGRSVLLLLALAAGAHGLALVDLWFQRQATARAVASEAADFMDSRVGALRAGLLQLAADPSVSATAALACTPELTARLVRESLRAPLVQRYALLTAADGRGCGPEGVVSSFDVPVVQPQSAAGLVGARSIARELLMVHTLADGARLVAYLDPRAMLLPSHGPWDRMASDGVSVTVMSGDGTPLQVWSERQGQTRRVVDASSSFDQAMRVRSTVHGIDVEVSLSDASFRRQAWVALQKSLALALLIGGAVLAWVWQRTLRRSRRVQRIEQGLRKRQFVPFIQPIVDLNTGRCVGGEILMRWDHPHRGIVSPGEFIEAAERSDLIIGMSDLVMRTAALRLAALAQAHRELYFSFNVTPGQLRMPNIEATLSDIFRIDTVPRDQVVIEITERDAVDPLAKTTVLNLHGRGWRIGIDDFGTGQSSLATLDALPIDRLKIDRAFVSTIDDSTRTRPVLDAIIAMARDLHIPLIAEGIETETQWNYLKSRHVASAQGYMIAKPMPLDAFLVWFADRQPDAQRNRASDAPEASSAQGLCDSIALQGVWDRMRGVGGVDIRDRSYHLRVYPQCFVARDAVDWIARDQRVSRAHAVRVGQALVAMGWIRHVRNEHDFADEELYFTAAERSPALQVSIPMDALRTSLFAPSAGLPMRDHHVGLLRHRQTMSGRAFVDWMVKRHECTREDALRWGAQLMRSGLLRHVYDDRPFSDNRELYRVGR